MCAPRRGAAAQQMGDWAPGVKSERHLVVFFMGTDSRSGRSLHNRMVAWFTGCRFTHCELHFPRDGVSYTTDVRAGHVYSTRRVRALAPGWRMEALTVTPRQYADALRFCRSAEGCEFATNAYYLYSLGPGCFYEPEGERPTYICARLVCEALQAARVLPPEFDARQINTGQVLAEVLRRGSRTVRPDAAAPGAQEAEEEDLMGGLADFAKKVVAAAPPPPRRTRRLRGLTQQQQQQRRRPLAAPLTEIVVVVPGVDDDGDRGILAAPAAPAGGFGGRSDY